MIFLYGGTIFFFKKKHQYKYTAKKVIPQLVHKLFLLYLYVDALACNNIGGYTSHPLTTLKVQHIFDTTKYC